MNQVCSRNQSMYSRKDAPTACLWNFEDDSKMRQYLDVSYHILHHEHLWTFAALRAFQHGFSKAFYYSACFTYLE